MLKVSFIHHVFVFLWAGAIAIDGRMNCARHSLIAVAISRALVYAGALDRRIRPAASLLVCLEFAILLLDPFLNMYQCDNKFVVISQAIFTLVYLCHTAWNKVKEIGIILVFEPQGDESEPVVKMMHVPRWARTINNLHQ